MENFYPIILDIITVFIGLVIIYKAWRQGFLKTIILVIGYVAAIFIAVYFSGIISNFVYDSFIRTRVVQSVEEVILNSADSSIEASVPFLVNLLPNFLKSIVIDGYGGEAGIIAILEENTQAMSLSVGDAVAEYVIYPVVILLLNIIFCILIFTICTLIVKTIAKMFSKFYAIPIIGPINSLLGGVLGVIQAVIILCIFKLVIDLTITLSSNSWSYLNSGIVDKTVILKLFDINFMS